MNSINKYIIFLIIIISIFTFLIRLYKFQADPDISSTISGAFYTDESFYATNAVKKILTGTFLCDNFNHILIVPVIPMIQYLSLKIFGTSLISIRLPSLILSDLLIFAFGFLVFISYKKRKNGLKIILPLSIFILCTNHIYLIYSRLAFLDIPMFFFGFVSMIFLYLGLITKKRNKMIFYLFSGLFLSISILTKTTGLLFFVSIFITFILIAWKNRLNNKKKFNKDDLLYFILTISISVFSCLLILLLLRKSNVILFNNISQIIYGNKVSGNFFNPIQVVLNFLKLLVMPFVWKNWSLFFLSFISIGLVFYKFIKNGTIRIIEIFFISIFFSLVLAFGFIGYKASRYLVILIVPISYFIGILPVIIKEFLRGSKNFNHINTDLIFTSVLILIIFCNAWNINRIFHYFTNLEFSINNFGKKVYEEIIKTNPYKKIIVCGRYTSLMALQNVNKYDICYDFSKLEKQDEYEIYVLETIRQDHDLDEFQETSFIDKKKMQELKFVDRYDILDNYHNIEFRLYETVP